MHKSCIILILLSMISKNAVILEKCSFRDNVTLRLYYGMLNLLAKSII
jgi:hypothetical protein